MTTHFGFESVSEEEKNKRVQDVFHRVAWRYDLMNDLMSMGLHRWWKKMMVYYAQPMGHEYVLDIATGTGDIAALLIPYLRNSQQQMVISDRNPSMLSLGCKRLWDQGLLFRPVLCDAEALPFVDNQFDLICISFGLRNVTYKEKALAEMYRVLKPQGTCLILEFSRPKEYCYPFYSLYSKTVIPWLGKVIANDEESYRYLIESIEKNPCQETLQSMMYTAGFASVHYENFQAGIVALHMGEK